MNIFIAIDSFKNCASSLEINQLLSNELKSLLPNSSIKSFPIADGGEGSLEVFSKLNSFQKIKTTHQNALNKKIKGYYLIHGKEAIIELAQSAGIQHIVPNSQTVIEANTFGCGEQILSAISNGVKQITLCIGGSASTDLGTGILLALGVKFFSNKKAFLPKGNQDLGKITSIDTGALSKYNDIKFTIICDVENTLCGKNGTVYTYAPQKGAQKEQLLAMEKNVELFAEILSTKERNDVKQIIGGGAAGGIACGLQLLKNVEIINGAEFLLKQEKIEKLISWADYIITGEGKIDFQSQYGKLPYQLLIKGKENNKKVIAICGDYEKKIDYNFDLILALRKEKMTTNEAIKNYKLLLRTNTKQIAKFIEIN